MAQLAALPSRVHRPSFACFVAIAIDVRVRYGRRESENKTTTESITGLAGSSGIFNQAITSTSIYWRFVAKQLTRSRPALMISVVSRATVFICLEREV